MKDVDYQSHLSGYRFITYFKGHGIFESQVLEIKKKKGARLVKIRDAFIHMVIRKIWLAQILHWSKKYPTIKNLVVSDNMRSVSPHDDSINNDYNKYNLVKSEKIWMS